MSMVFAGKLASCGLEAPADDIGTSLYPWNLLLFIRLLQIRQTKIIDGVCCCAAVFEATCATTSPNRGAFACIEAGREYDDTKASTTNPGDSTCCKDVMMDGMSCSGNAECGEGCSCQINGRLGAKRRHLLFAGHFGGVCYCARSR